MLNQHRITFSQRQHSNVALIGKTLSDTEVISICFQLSAAKIQHHAHAKHKRVCMQYILAEIETVIVNEYGSANLMCHLKCI